jgi:hypothetical protein
MGILELNWSWSKFTTDSQSASMSWCQAPIWDLWPIFLSPWNFLQTDACLLFCSALSDERMGLQFTVQLLLGLARAVTLGSKSRRTHGHILLSHLRIPQPGGPGSRLYPPGTGWPSYTPGQWVPFLSPLTTRRGGGILTRLHTGIKVNSKSKSHYDRQSVGHSVLVSGAHLLKVKWRRS